MKHEYVGMLHCHECAMELAVAKTEQCDRLEEQVTALTHGAEMLTAQLEEKEREIALLDRLLESASTAISNLVLFAGHESILLREHPEPCNRLDFCVVKDALQRYAVIEDALTPPERKEQG